MLIFLVYISATKHIHMLRNIYSGMNLIHSCSNSKLQDIIIKKHNL